MKSSSRLLPAVLLLAPLAALTSGCELMIAGPREQASDRWEKTYPVAANGTLEIENTNGGITVRPHAQPTIQITAHRTARAVTQEGARELLAKLNLEQSATTDLVKLATPRSQGPSIGQQIEVRYDVLVPATIAVNLTTVNGEVDIEGVAGPVALETVNGGIVGRGVGRLRRAETVNGGVKLALAGVPTDGMQVETVNGSVSLALPDSAGALLSVRTVNGGIDVEGFANVSDAERKRRHYEGRLNGGGPRLRVETVNGGVSITGATAATASAAAAGGQ